MKKPIEFNFGDQSVAEAYDTVLVPILFEPWATQIIENFQPWNDQCVLDLATGTGVVADQLSKQVGPSGKVIGTDINGEMLSFASQKCVDASLPVEFIESPAHPLALPDESIDTVVCQQGFQFFPDRYAVAGELFRVLRKPGRVIVTTWRPVEECEFFGKVCEALESIGEAEISDLLRIPFDFMPESELIQYFKVSGFQNVHIMQQQLDLTFHGGVAEAVDATYSTPIGPKLRGLKSESQHNFKVALTTRLEELSPNGTGMGRMVSNVLVAEKVSDV